MREQVHVTLGHTTVMAEAQYFGLPDSSSQSPAAALASTISRIGQLALNVRVLRTEICLRPGGSRRAAVLW